MPLGQWFLVRRDDLTQTQLAPLDTDSPLESGQVRARIHLFAFAANNISYAVLGNMRQHWRFFPAADGWGIVPAWGFATVERSACEGVALSERLYGYWPLATHALLQPGPIGVDGFSDASPHRAELPAVYNRYLTVDYRHGPDAMRKAYLEVMEGWQTPVAALYSVLDQDSSWHQMRPISRDEPPS